jgi:nucleotide-binding universal stress UspA family protein
VFKRILVPIDGSPTSDRGLDQALKLARGQKAALCLLHIVDEHVIIQQADVAATGTITENFLESLRDGGRKVLARAQARALKQRVRSKPVLVENIVHAVSDVIVDNARKWRADLIVMGTHGRRGITRMVMGSDAEGVVRNTPVPVLLVRAAGRKKR